jgi:hypothetical protein
MSIDPSFYEKSWEARITNLKNLVKNTTNQLIVEAVQEMGIETASTKLEAIPAEIKRLQTELNEAQHRVEYAKGLLDQEKAVIVATVAVDKANFPNDAARGAEVTRLQSASLDYLKAKGDHQVAEGVVSGLIADIEMKRNEMANLRSILGARAAQISALAGLLNN